MNTLYFGDCLDVLKELHKEHPEGYIDLIYIDPPFNSKRDYNILFEEVDLKDATAQKQAFADTWSNVSYFESLSEIQEIDLSLYTFLNTLNNINISKSAVSYLTTMAIRIWYIHKVLKDTGSFYLHCDTTMSHYLKMVCDLIFDEGNFRNEITWKRFNFHADAKRFGRVSDRILFYSKSEEYLFNRQKEPFSEEYIGSKFIYEDKKGKYRLDNLNPPGGRGPVYEYNGITKPWRYTKEKMLQLEKEGRIYKDSKTPQVKRYLNEQEGQAVNDIWSDIPPINSQAKERLGYPTQKPEALLERIIKSSSNENDIVADFFCGCGTTIAVAQRLKRNWLGADISYLAIRLVKNRILDPYRSTDRLREIKDNIEIRGIPKDIGSAKELARNVDKGRFGFQEWIIELMIGGICNPKLTADGGWDGHITFEVNDEKHTVLIEVKSGHVNVKNIREFIQVVEKQKAKIGVFVCFKDEVTKEMEREAKAQGYYNKGAFGTTYDKIQILTVEDLLEGKNVKMPISTKTTFKKSSKTLESEIEQKGIFD
jgi:DNA modification methylase